MYTMVSPENTKWNKMVEQFIKRVRKLEEAGYSGQGHTSGAESFYGGYFGYGGDKQLAAKPIAAVRKLKKQTDAELKQNFKDQQEKNRGYPAEAGAASGFAGGDGGGGGGSGVRIPNRIAQIGKTAKELDVEFDQDPTKSYWGKSIPDEPEEPYDSEEDLVEQAAAGGSGGGPVRGGASDGNYRDLPGFPRMNSLDDKQVFVPPVEGDYDGDGEEDKYLEHDEYVDDILRLNNLEIQPGKLQKVFYPDGMSEAHTSGLSEEVFSEHTLYHGTIIDNLESIKELGLSGELGDFVGDAYGMEVLDDDELEGITFAADKKTLDSAVGAMRYNIGKKLGKWLGDVTEDEIKKYGMLVIIKDIDKPENDKYYNHEEDSGYEWHQRPNKQEEQGYYSSYPISVEPGDWFLKGSTDYDIILTGAKMMDFLRRNNGLQHIVSDKKRRAIKLSVLKFGADKRDGVVKKILKMKQSEVDGLLRKLEKDPQVISALKSKNKNTNEPEQLDLKFEAKKREKTLAKLFLEAGDYGSPGGALARTPTERYKQGKWNQEPAAELLIKPVDYSGGHTDVPAADHSNGGIGYGNIISPKSFVPGDWEQRNWRTEELPVEAENLEKLEMGEDVSDDDAIVERRGVVTSKKLVKKMKKHKDPGCEKVRQKGSHAFYKCGSCSTTVPVHGSKDLPRGTVGAIEKDLSSCLGDDWLEEVVNAFVKEVFEEAYTGIDDDTGNGPAKGGSEAFEKNKKEVIELDKKQRPKGAKKDLKNYHLEKDIEENND